MKKVIISDFDDTLYIDGKISDEVVLKINEFRNQGNLFIIATGSSYTSFNRKIASSNIKYDYLLVNHGSTIYKNNNIILNEPIDKIALNEIIKKYELINNGYILKASSPGNFFSTAKEGLVTPDAIDITKIHLEFNEKDFKKEFLYLKNKYNDICNIYDVYDNRVEIISKKVSKLSSIEYILKLEKISDENVYAIGDGYSDIEIIKKYNGYAMKNSVFELKKYAIKQVNDLSELVEDLL